MVSKILVWDSDPMVAITCASGKKQKAWSEGWTEIAYSLQTQVSRILSLHLLGQEHLALVSVENTSVHTSVAHGKTKFLGPRSKCQN